MIDLIKRITPQLAEHFILEDLRVYDGKDTFEIEGKDSKIILRGANKISLCLAYGTYLREFCNADLLLVRTGALSGISLSVPGEKIRRSVSQTYRLCMTYETYSYSCTFWDFERWEKEIDYMALHGVNTPMCIIGADAVLYEAMLSQGFNKTETLSFISGSVYFPYQLGNLLDSFSPNPDEKILEQNLIMGKKIIERVLSLGMTPLQQGFINIIPLFTKRVKPKAKMLKVEAWNNFHTRFMPVPGSDFFMSFVNSYLSKQGELLGNHGRYIFNPFTDNKSRYNKEFLSTLAQSTAKVFTDIDADALWFIDAGSAKEDLIKNVPLSRIVIIDTYGDMAQKTEGFWGYNFIAGDTANIHGRTGITGKINAVADNIYKRAKAFYPNAAGSGFFAHSLEDNPMYCALSMQMLTENEAIDKENWIQSYTAARYKTTDEKLVDVYKDLWKTCYSDDCAPFGTGSLVCARPACEITHAAPNDCMDLPYDNGDLRAIIENFLECETVSPWYEHDLCDLTRQYISNLARPLHKSIVEAFFAQDVAAFESDSNSFQDLLGDLDRLLMTRKEFTLFNLIQSTKKAAPDDSYAAKFEAAVLMIITLWGPSNHPTLYDNAWREIGGMVKDFYLPRWHLFFKTLAMNFKKPHKYKDKSKSQILERNEYAGTFANKCYEYQEKSFLTDYIISDENVEKESTTEIVKKLLEKY